MIYLLLIYITISLIGGGVLISSCMEDKIKFKEAIFVIPHMVFEELSYEVNFVGALIPSIIIGILSFGISLSFIVFYAIGRLLFFIIILIIALPMSIVFLICTVWLKLFKKKAK